MLGSSYFLFSFVAAPDGLESLSNNPEKSF
jgi:hypothetical protein